MGPQSKNDGVLEFAIQPTTCSFVCRIASRSAEPRVSGAILWWPGLQNRS